MAGTDNGDAEPKIWWENRTLVIVWLLFFFPIGLYGVWKGELFDRKMKMIITSVVVAVLLILGGGEFMDFLYIFILCPTGIYLLWKDPVISKSTTYRFGGAFVLILIASFTILPTRQPISPDGPGGSCTAVTNSGGCTYYRDSSCRVIAKQCN